MLDSEAAPSTEEVDEGSCICGLNLDILNKLEALIQLGSEQSCSAQSGQPQSVLSEHLLERDPQLEVVDGKPTSQESQLDAISQNDSSSPSPNLDSDSVISDTSNTNLTSDSSDKGVDNGQEMQDLISKLTTELHDLQIQIQTIKGRPKDTPPNNVNPSSSSLTNQNNNKADQKVPNSAIDSGFLTGLPATQTNEALMKLNQSSAVKPQEVADAVQLTVPNVVSNIFSNINNLTSQAGQEEDRRDIPGKLTSIDGSSVNINGSSSDQIIAEGEKLFLKWIEHQLDSLHLTVSTANYIRKNAINLFRKISQQYVERMKKVGGKLEDNVLKGTQIALYNTELLVTFLCKNYINFAAGLMQMIGEGVSSVGKQIDSTGDTIAHFNVNPLTIVTNVLDSLPNPSDYSKYFIAFGKQIMGESTNSTDDNQKQSSPSQSQQEDTSSKTEPANQGKQPGLIRKTMGALSKSLGSLIG